MSDRPAAMHKPDTAKVIAALKPFQQRSVDYVFDRMYGENPTRRFLLADEVGLGKTLVARGVVARIIDRLWDEVPRIDIIYICSNQDIARQNISRLNVTGKDDYTLATRITLLPIARRDEQRNSRINFISLTPQTSFEPGGGMGEKTERALLFRLLEKPWRLKGAAPLNVFQGKAHRYFRSTVDRLREQPIDLDIERRFLEDVAKKPELRRKFAQLCDDLPRQRKEAGIPQGVKDRRRELVGELRSLLAVACLKSLEPNLIILDEFQRFRDLLSTDSESGLLARDLFDYSEGNTHARVLLLSATPYKMYTMRHEREENDHYGDFLQTMAFLFQHDAPRIRELKKCLDRYGRLLYSLGEDDGADLERVRGELQPLLRSVMCRTERLAVSANRSGMLEEIPNNSVLHTSDAMSYMAVQRVARAIGHHDTMEYWKSAPYLLSFMDNYKLKDDFRQRSSEEVVYQAIKDCGVSDGVSLPWQSIESYLPIDPHNPRLRNLMADTIEQGAWEALWIPPAMSYYESDGPVSELSNSINRSTTGFTKRLVFSSWQVVPKTVATLLSYEAERLMVKRFDPSAENKLATRNAMRNRLNFSTHERLHGMPVLAMMYPSIYLAREFDPLTMMRNRETGRPLNRDDVLTRVESAIQAELQPYVDAAKGEENGPDWYWAAPLLLDRNHYPTQTKVWWALPDLANSWSRGEEHEQDKSKEDAEVNKGWQDHVERAAMLFRGDLPKGRPPTDLSRVLALLAIGGPAVCALRALSRVSGGSCVLTDPDHRLRAGRVAWGFRSLFNAPDVMAMIRGRKRDEPYWQRVLEYCVDGCLQAVLDEYAHILPEWLGVAGKNSAVISAKVSQTMADALSLHVATPGVDRIVVDDRGHSINTKPERLRARFAMRFGDEKETEGGGPSRADQVRGAFNSPFWPFVLITTSVGQEGLDFHNYCHAVVHWNLPSNPVDLEQREGRVHRYKGHAVRRNVARHYQDRLVGSRSDDAWQSLFEYASADDAGKSGGLIPYWIFTTPGGAFIERHVPVLPLSREAEHLPALRSSLAVYRMVFGQPRQDDLLQYLARTLDSDAAKTKATELCLDLSPVVI